MSLESFGITEINLCLHTSILYLFRNEKKNLIVHFSRNTHACESKLLLVPICMCVCGGLSGGS